MRLVLMLAVMASLYNIFLDIKLVQFGLLIKIAGHAYVRADKHTVYKRPHQLLLREHVVKFKAWQDVIHCQATVWSDSGCWALANCLTNKPLKEMGLRRVWLHSWSLWTRKKKDAPLVCISLNRSKWSLAALSPGYSDSLLIAEMQYENKCKFQHGPTVNFHYPFSLIACVQRKS